jgi:drug/metabolite transporter (DMT)-like permease
VAAPSAPSRAASPSLTKLVLAFAAIYVIWGSTYLGIRFTIETLPPFFTNGIRFAVAGVVMYLWARLSGAPHPPAREWRAGLVTGFLLFFCGTGAVIWAELGERGIPSGVAALVVATEPLSFVLIEAVRRRRMPKGAIFAGLALGLLGLGILVGPGNLLGSERFDLAACGVLVGGTFCWASGSLYSRGSRMPASPVMATAVTLLAGGTCLAALGLFAGELGRFDPSGVSTRSVVAVLYNFVFGSIVGFTAYLWLLRVASVSRVSTYAYVNPIVAVFLGWALAGEALTPRVFLAAAVIVAAVALIIRAGGEDAPELDREDADLGCTKAPETLHA